MGILLADTNIYFNAACAFWAIMNIVGFCLMLTDKKRWLAQKKRSDAMMSAHKKKPAEEAEIAPEDKKSKKTKKEEPFEYQPRIPEKALFAVAVLFGAFGELFAMIILRHKWYKFAFRVYMPIITVLNILIGGVILVLLYTRGDTSAIYTIQ